MNAIKIIFASLLLGGLAVSCVSTPYNDGYGNRNGTYGNTRVYRAPDGTVYRQGDIYRDRNGNTYRNGKVYQYARVYNKRNLPPGQAKKVYGGNAKDYAYGQQKKNDRYYKGDGNWNDDRWDRDHHKNKKSKKNKGKKH